jgi:hypothetical protein
MSTLASPSAAITLAPLHPLPHPVPARRSSLGSAKSAPSVWPTSNRLRATWVSVIARENGRRRLEMSWEVTSQQ